MRNRAQRGFTLIELLVVVAIVGVLSAIVVWNYFIAIQRAKQTRSMADMRTIAMSWELYAQDTESYIPAAAVFTFPSTPVVAGDLEKALVPDYVKNFPKKDGWGNDYDFAVNSSSTLYAIRCSGADGQIDASYDANFTESFNNDIILTNGVFIVSPKNK